MRRRAFTLIELIIAMCILGIMAASLTLRPDSVRQTAKREADRIVTQLYRLIETANRRHVTFKVLFDGSEQTGSVRVEWQTSSTSQYHHTSGDQELKISKGCSIQNLRYTLNESNNMVSRSTESFNLGYDIGKNSFIAPGATLQVNGADKSVHYIIIYVPGSRIRTSDKKP